MIRPLPLAPNWRESVKIEYEFKTDIITSRSGREQRRALRQTPRVSIRFLQTLAGETRRAFNTLLAVAQNRSAWLIDPTVPPIRAATGIVVDGSSTTVDNVPPWLAVGQHVALVDGSRAEVRTVVEVTGSTLSLSASLGRAWPAGTQVRHLMGGRLDPKIAVESVTNDIGEAQILFATDPGNTALYIASEAGVTFAGCEIFPFIPNWAESVSGDFTTERSVVDFERGRTATYTPVQFQSRTRQATFVGRNPGQVDAIVGFFMRMRGRAGEFYMPTGDIDLVPRRDAGPGQSVLRVIGQSSAAPFEDDTVRRAIAIVLRNGVTIYRTVVDVTFVDDSTGADTEIHCSTSFDTPIGPANIVRVSWMPRWRLASDTLEIEWLTNTIAQTQLNLQTIEDLPNN